jgi:hypothetical protein
VQHHVTAALQAASSRVTATHSMKHVAAASATNAAAATTNSEGNSASGESVAAGDGSGSAAAIATAASLIEFRAVASQLRPLLAAVRAWGAAGSTCVSAAEYRQLLTDCLTQYYNHRYRVLCAEIEAHVRRLPPTLAFVDLIRSACTFVIGLGTLEQRLFTEFFPTSAASDAVAVSGKVGHPGQGASDAAIAETLTDLLENVGHTVHALLRPTIIRLADVDSLSEVAAVLRFEVLEDQLSAAKAKASANASGSIGALVHTPLTFVVHRMLQDVQERLVYRAQMYVRDEVSNYRLTAADTELIVARAAGHEGAGAADTSAQTPDAAAAATAVSEPKQPHQQQWFTTLSRTLTLLAKLHRCLDAGVFRRLAQDALSACTASLLRATLWIRSAQGTARAATMGAIDADLFLIKHLLVLRERIAPFDVVDAKITQKTLDFTRMREKIAAVLTRRASLLSFLHDEAGAERPLVAEQTVDTARDVERELKAACELLIRRETGALVGGMLSFLAKLAAPGACAALFGAAGTDEQQQQAAVLCEAIVTETARAFPAGPRALAAKLSAYLGNPVTEKVLLKPVRSNVHDTFERMRAVLTQYCATDAAVRLAAALPDFDAHSL